jgi:P27 family predicted phage terminase small subunit
MAENLPVRRLRAGKPRETAPGIPKAPPGLSPSTRRLWSEVTHRWALDAAALALLQAACEARDRYQQAAKVLAKDGPTIGKGDERKIHPAHVCARDNLREFRQLVRQLGLEVPSE